MRSLLRSLFALALLTVGLGAAAGGRAQSDSTDAPCRVRRIYVAAVGESAEAERFREELERRLKGKRFTTVASAGEAEASLTGRFSFTGNSGSGRLAFETAELRDAAGARLWHGSFYYTYRGRRSLMGGGAFKDAAGKVAANLRGACR